MIAVRTGVAIRMVVMKRVVMKRAAPARLTRRVSGSHHIYSHSKVPRPLSLQPRQRQAKPYQISQFLEMVAEYALTIEPSDDA